MVTRCDTGYLDGSRRRYYVTAIDDGRVVGNLTAHLHRRPALGRRQLWVIDIAVHEDRRREGVASGMARPLHRRFPDYVVVHNRVHTYEVAQWARSLPQRWNRVYTDRWDRSGS